MKKTLIIIIVSFLMFSNMIECVVEYSIPGTEEIIKQKKRFPNTFRIEREAQKSNTKISSCQQLKPWHPLIILLVIFGTPIAVLLIFGAVSERLDLYLYKKIKPVFVSAYNFFRKINEKQKSFVESFPEIIYYESGDLIEYENEKGNVKTKKYIGAKENGTIFLCGKADENIEEIHYSQIIKNKNYDNKKADILKKQLKDDFFNTKLRQLRELNQEDSK